MPIPMNIPVISVMNFWIVWVVFVNLVKIIRFKKTNEGLKQESENENFYSVISSSIIFSKLAMFALITLIFIKIC